MTFSYIPEFSGSHCDCTLCYFIQGVPRNMTVGFECLLPHTVLDITDFLQFISLKKCLTHTFYCEINITII